MRGGTADITSPSGEARQIPLISAAVSIVGFAIVGLVMTVPRVLAAMVRRCIEARSR